MAYVGKDLPHDSAVTHVTGESIFVDDHPPLHGELLADVVPSPLARGRVRSIDVSLAKKVPGVHAVLLAADIPGPVKFGPVVHDEELMVTTDVMFVGQPLAVIAAETREALELAKKAVVFDIEPLPAILTIDEAVAVHSYLGAARKIERGDIDAGFAEAEHVTEGVLEIGGQEHFYLEPQTCLAIPGEQGTMTIHSSTQHPSEVQALVAETLNVPFNHVTCLCKRMGGGFGGKETQAAQPAMIAAALAGATRRPVRFVYNRDDDMAFTGKRHPYKIVYRAGFRSDGTLTAVDVQLYSNGGCSTDLSFAVLERSMLHSDNAYFIPNIRIVGRACRTNLPSNTAFRGFGGPQGVAGIENIVEQIAIELGKDAIDVRRANLYGIDDRNVTPYGQIVGNNTLHKLFGQLSESCKYNQRRAEISAFNASHRWQLKGMALSPVKFGLSFTRRTLNQANALVNIYTDGSVMVSTGATEMGQGVNTRIKQIVADALGVTMNRVLLSATNTDKNNNTSPTAASTGTDLNGAAALDACKRLRQGLAEIASHMLADAGNGLAGEPDRVRFFEGSVFDERAPAKVIAFRQVVARAYELRVSLGERGFYATPGVDFNRETGKGTPFFYFTNGVACSEVLIDRLTGEMSVSRVDLLMDVGRSISPGIDRGQVVGGFIQGMGWVTTEELVYSPTGVLLTHSPDTYKIPAISDVPPVFNVAFLDNPDNAVSIHRSKSVGEPPLLLGLSVWLAVKNAVSYVNPAGAKSLRLPATGERILEALGEFPRRAQPGRREQQVGAVASAT